jgi:hypothetical protein
LSAPAPIRSDRHTSGRTPALGFLGRAPGIARRTSRWRLASLVCWLALGVAPAAAGASGDTAELASGVAEIRELVADAHFRTALGVADATRVRAEELAAEAAADTLRAELEVLAATCQVALGKEAAARRSLARARSIWPSLQLDETSTSPRLVRIFQKLGPVPPIARSAR